MTDVDDERYQRGLAKYREVYGDDAWVSPPGRSDIFDAMIGQLFGEVWSRPALAVDARRLIVMGVLAAQHRFDTLGTQFRRALTTGELTVEQVREIAIHLVQYVGYPSMSDLFRVSEQAIGEHAKAASTANEGASGGAGSVGGSTGASS